MSLVYVLGVVLLFYGVFCVFAVVSFVWCDFCDVGFFVVVSLVRCVFVRLVSMVWFLCCGFFGAVSVGCWCGSSGVVLIRWLRVCLVS